MIRVNRNCWIAPEFVGGVYYDEENVVVVDQFDEEHVADLERGESLRDGMLRLAMAAEMDVRDLMI